MFDGLLKSKFHNKCKSAITLTKTRLEIIKRKRNAMQKFLKIDIADLLRTGFDIYAYGRAEGLLAEMNRSTCYDLVEQFVEHISNNLSVMDKQRECPEDCREAVASLMYAAARFADLPELRELRTLFAQRYGNSLDWFVNKEFVEKFKSSSPTKDVKLQVMQDIATEAGLDWNRKATEQKLYNPPVSGQNVRKDDGKYTRRIEQVVPEEYKPRHLYHNPEGRSTFKDIQVDSRVRKGQEVEPDSTEYASQEEFDDHKKAAYYSSVSPPYTKSKVRQAPNKHERQEPPESEEFSEREDMQHPYDSVSESKRKPTSVRTLGTKSASGNDDYGQRDEEERMIDRLLMHYSLKKSPKGTCKTEPVLQPPPQKATINSGKATRYQSWDTPPTHPSETKMGHARTASLPHIHPKLPDYDDLVARLAAFRGGKLK